MPRPSLAPFAVNSQLPISNFQPVVSIWSWSLGVGSSDRSRVSRGCDRLGHVGKTEEDDIDALFQLTPPEFVTARNALATQLKKAGRDDVASRVKTLPKPSISAWTVNQLYWKHRAAFEKLLANGERFRQAQVSRLAGKGTDIHKLLNERREELSAMSRLAAEILQRSSGAAPSGVMRRITATLEALSAYGTLAGCTACRSSGRGCGPARIRRACGARTSRRRRLPRRRAEQGAHVSKGSEDPEGQVEVSRRMRRSGSRRKRSS